MTISAAVLITWKAPSDNEYNLRNAIWEHYVTIIEKLCKQGLAQEVAVWTV